MKIEVFILLSIIGWGIGSFFYKLANNVMHPIMISTIIMLVDIPLLLLGFLVMKFDKTITPMGVLYSSLVAVFYTIGTVSFAYALKSGGDVGKTTIVTSLYPALTLTLSMFFLGEVLTIKKGIGIALALVSFLLLSLK
jgi:uncharacterized membrane protein